ncbi:prepilin peptidase [Candidatus Woesearchaeota archaeon]|nr:prepilin peptidase [Candidatus Woesearchaeota archaeon]
MAAALGTLNIATYSIASAALLVGTFTDLKWREVPDWVSYGTIFSGLGIHLLLSIIFGDYRTILFGLAGFLIFLGFAFIMFYSGQWGGGDSKLLMGLGALFGLHWGNGEVPFLASFFLNVLIVGALYGLLWSFFLIARNRRAFAIELKKILKKKMVITGGFAGIVVSLSLLVAMLFAKNPSGKTLLGILAGIIPTFLILWAVLKAAEKACMFRNVAPTLLTEGDWIAKEIAIDGKYICGPKDLGVSKTAIRKLIAQFRRGKIRNVLIKDGIPFVPSFLLAFILTLWKGNIFFLLLAS